MPAQMGIQYLKVMPSVHFVQIFLIFADFSVNILLHDLIISQAETQAKCVSPRFSFRQPQELGFFFLLKLYGA